MDPTAILKDWLKVIQLRARYLFGIWIISLFFLFLPENLTSKFGFSLIIDEYRGWIGIITVCAFFFWIIQLIPIISKYLANRKQQIEFRNKIEEHITTLSMEELIIIAFCLTRNQRTVNLPITYSAINSLRDKGFVTIATQGSIISCPFTIPSYVWNILQINRYLIIPDELLERNDFRNALNRFEDDMNNQSINLM